MNSIYILKMGSTFPESVSRIGDFDEWILRSLPADVHELVEVSRRDRPFPDPHGLRGVIITGSHGMVTQTNAWERKAMHWLRWVLEEKLPVLGICYGHQMIAHVLGGLVGYIPEGPEIGYQRLQFLGDYEADPLFGLYPSHFEAFAFHYQTVLRLPEGAKVLARSGKERHHAVRYRDWVWGVQYHPEFNAGVSAEYLIHDAREIERYGHDVRQLLRAAEEERPPDPLIPRFADLVLYRE